MKKHSALLLILLAGWGTTGCGTGGGGDAGVFGGADEFAVPFLPNGGETMSLGLKNVASTDAVVTLTPYSPAGAPVPGPVTTTIVARGEQKFIVNALFAGFVADGWIHVETRDAVTLAPLATTGFVIPSFSTQAPGPRGETGPGLVFTDERASLPIIAATTALTLINATRDVVVPTTFVALDVNVTFFNTNGDAVAGPTPFTLNPNEAFLVPIPIVGLVGSVRVDPVADATKLAAYTMATKELPFTQLALGFDYDADIARQPADQPGQSEVAVEFGLAPAGDYRDFAVVMTNSTDLGTVVTVEAIYNFDGASILTVPRTITLAPRATRYVATSFVESVGFLLGEPHPWDDLFGNVFLRTDLLRLRISIRHGDGVVLSFRNFDPNFQQSRQTVPSYELVHDAVVPSIDQELITNGAERNWISLMNRDATDLDIIVRVFTPLGVEYQLPTVTVPALQRLDVSPDAIFFKNLLGIREDQNDPTSVPVPFYSFRFTAAGRFGINARREVRDPSSILILVTPHVIEPLDD